MGKLRLWRGHTDHMHVRLKCPKGSPGCKPYANAKAYDTKYCKLRTGAAKVHCQNGCDPGDFKEIFTTATQDTKKPKEAPYWLTHYNNNNRIVDKENRRLGEIYDGIWLKDIKRKAGDKQDRIDGKAISEKMPAPCKAILDRYNRPYDYCHDNDCRTKPAR